MKYETHSAAETRKVASDFFKKTIGPRAASEPVLIGLTGDLGVGKTTFVQGMAKGAGIDPDYYVNSPTFTLVNEYRGQGATILHVDLYRIEKPIEGMTLGIEDYLRPGTVIVIEWPERMPELAKDLNFKVRFEMVSDKKRIIEISSPRLRHPSPT